MTTTHNNNELLLLIRLLVSPFETNKKKTCIVSPLAEFLCSLPSWPSKSLHASSSSMVNGENLFSKNGFRSLTLPKKRLLVCANSFLSFLFCNSFYFFFFVEQSFLLIFFLLTVKSVRHVNFLLPHYFSNEVESLL